MESLKKAAAILAVAILAMGSVRLGAVASGSQEAAVRIDMPTAKSLILTVQGRDGVSGIPSLSGPSDEGGEQELGGVSNGLQYVDRLSVYGRSEGNVAKSAVAEMRAPSFATTTACVLTNEDRRARVVTAIGVIDRGTDASAGSVVWTAGTSTSSGAPLGATKAVATAITRVSGRDILTTTSTAQSAYFTWQPNETINFVSGTTTNYGRCFVDYAGL